MVVERRSDLSIIKISSLFTIPQLIEKFIMLQCNAFSAPIHPDIDRSIKSGRDEGEYEKLPRVPYMELVGSLVHLSNTTRPDISYACYLLSRCMQDTRRCHWNAAKAVLRYLKGTKDCGIVYSRNGKRHGYTDADYAVDRDDRESTSGYVLLNSGGAISWRSKKLAVFAQYSCESEYVAMSYAVHEAIRIRRSFGELLGAQRIGKNFSLMVDADNQGDIKIACNNVVNKRSVHIEVRYHFVGHHVKKGTIKLPHVETAKMVADVKKKLLERQKYRLFCEAIGLQS